MRYTVCIMRWGCVTVERTLFVVKPEDITPSLPDPVTLTVKAISDTDTPITYTWYHYDEQSACEENWCQVFNVSDKTYIANDNGSSLTILNTERSDLGRYRCVASNGVSMDIFEVQLLIPPHLGKYCHVTQVLEKKLLYNHRKQRVNWKWSLWELTHDHELVIDSSRSVVNLIKKVLTLQDRDNQQLFSFSWIFSMFSFSVLFF